MAVTIDSHHRAIHSYLTKSGKTDAFTNRWSSLRLTSCVDALAGCAHQRLSGALSACPRWGYGTHR
jgi:hypothetical protein